jgi:hypothetical protein
MSPQRTHRAASGHNDDDNDSYLWTSLNPMAFLFVLVLPFFLNVLEQQFIFLGDSSSKSVFGSS